MIKFRKLNLFVYLIAILIAFVSFESKSLYVNAWSCGGSCSGGAGACIKKCNGKCCLWSSTGNFDCEVNLSGDEFECNSGPSAGCTCGNNRCKKGSGGMCTNVGQICSCSCNPVACPPGIPGTKYMTRPVVTGHGVSCNGGGCDGQSYACPPQFLNNAPTCAILPGTIELNREDLPKQFTLSVTDQDYGDAVDVTAVEVVDTAGNLNSCIRVTSVAGGSLIGPIKAGSNNASDITKATPFLVDAREAHGIYQRDPNSGASICSGILKVEVKDLDSDLGGADTSDKFTCSVNVKVTNQAPQLKAVSLFDKDNDQNLRESGNLINGVNTSINVGSSFQTAEKLRASYCNEPLSILDPIRCPGGGEKYLRTRHNPLLFEFTVSDANGSDDIMQAGVWLQYQQAGTNVNIANLPPVAPNPNPTARYSFQALYSEKESKNIAGQFYFISRGCLSSACGQLNLATSAKQIFSGLALINGLGSYAGDGTKIGNLLNGKQQIATTNEWHQKGFPDCLQTDSCTGANIPTVATSLATANAAAKSNYAWAVGSDDTHLLCYPSNSNVPTVIQASTPVVCPANCAACIKREGVAQTGNANEMKFSFGIYFNDKDAGQGMVEGKYSLLVSALDKVGVPIASVTGKGDEGWTRFDKAGNVCAGASCAANTDFALLYDPIPPKVTFDKWVASASQLDTITATGLVSDNAGGSGVAGISNRFIARQTTLDGEPLDERAWAKKVDGVTEFNGSQDHDATFRGGAITMLGKGLVPEESIIAGACAYDFAGNMSCGRNSNEYVFLSAWLKTSFGDIYSSKSGSSPFAYTIPTNTTINALINTDNTSKKDAIKSPNIDIYAPYTEQIFTAGTGIVLTGASSTMGLSGGYVAAGSTVSLPLGFKGNYRNGNEATKNNLFAVSPLTLGSEFDRTRSTAILNCDLLNESTPGTCQTSGSIADVSSTAAKIKLLSTGTTTINTLVCNQVNIIFVSGTVTVTGNVTKADKTSGCIFVLSSGSSLVIDDISSNQRTASPDGKGSPYVDRFEAAIVAANGATIKSRKPFVKPSGTVDRLEITGWVYAADSVPQFLRSLAPVDNRRYPSEWIVYDATLLDLFRPILGIEKTIDLTCGTSKHVLCTTVK